MNFNDLKKQTKSCLSYVVGAGVVYLFFKLLDHFSFLFPAIPNGGLKVVLIMGSIGISWTIFILLTEKLLNLMYPPKENTNGMLSDNTGLRKVFEFRKKSEIWKNINERRDVISFYLSKVDREIIDSHQGEQKQIIDELDTEWNELSVAYQSAQTLAESKSYLRNQSIFWDKLLDTELTYFFQSEDWIFEHPKRTLNKLDSNLFGSLNGTHLLYPSENGVGGTKGYFLLNRGFDGESVSVDFVKIDEESEISINVFSFPKLDKNSSNWDINFTKMCLDNSLPALRLEIWGFMILAFGSLSKHLEFHNRPFGHLMFGENFIFPLGGAFDPQTNVVLKELSPFKFASVTAGSQIMK